MARCKSRWCEFKRIQKKREVILLEMFILSFLIGMSFIASGLKFFPYLFSLEWYQISLYIIGAILLGWFTEKQIKPLFK